MPARNSEGESRRVGHPLASADSRAGYQETLKERLRRPYAVFNLLRCSLAQWILPRKCFVQINPNAFECMGLYPELREEMRQYNWDTTIAQRALCVDGNRVTLLRILLAHAEAGTYTGLSARLIHRHMARGAQLHCFDTFDGFDEHDLETEKTRTGVLASGTSPTRPR